MNLSIDKYKSVKCQRALNYIKKYPQYQEVFKKIYTELLLEGRSCIHIYQTLIKTRMLLDHCGSLENLSEECVKEFLAGKAKSYYGVVKKTLKIFSKEYPHLKEIYDAVHAPKQKMTLPPVLTKEEVERIINSAEDLRQRVVIAVMYETGVRISELLNIRYGDVTPFEYGYKIRIPRSKSMPRTVLVVEYSYLLTAWLNQKSWKKDERIFPYSGDTVRLWLKKIGRKIGVNIYPHLLRHSRATHLYGRLSEKEMMILFGWNKRDMLDIYAHLTENDAHKHLLQLYGVEKKQESQERKAIKCPRCGTTNPPNAQYCIRCGYPLKPEIIAEIHKKQAEKERVLQELKQLAEEIKELKERLGL